MADDTLLDLTTLIVANHVSNNCVEVSELPALIQSVHDALKGLGQSPAKEAAAEEYKPAVSVRSSVKHEHIVSLIDGKPYKMLKRHIGRHGLTPKEYRQRYGLKDDYPMVAPAYAEQRKALALKIGLGKKPTAEPAPKKARAKRNAATEEAPVSE